MQVELFKRERIFTTSDGAEKRVENFFVKCGDTLVPVVVKFFGTEEKHDYQYSGRKMILSSFAMVLPEVPASK